MSLLDHLMRAHWAMDAGAYERMQAIIERHDAGIRLTPEQIQAAIGRAPETPHPRDRQYQVHQGIALVPVQGILSKHAAAVGDISAPSGSNYESLAKDLRQAANDPEVRGIMLHAESPGGVVDGVQGANAAVRAAGLIKPVRAFIDGIGASALLWAICPAARIDASATALVGSIGVVRTVEDTSARDAKNGRKTIVLRSGALKAPGQPGEAWTDAQIADAQAIIDGMGAMFAADLAAGRHLNPVQMAAITDGRVHLAADAQRLGLIDSVRSFDESLADFVHAASFPQRRSAPAASTPSTTGNQTMKIAPDRLAALVKDHQSKAVLITSMAAGSATAEPSTEADIVAALAAEASKDLAVQVTTLEAQLVAAKAAHAADVTALKAQLAEATAKAAIDTPKGVKALDGSAPPAPIAADPVAAYHAKLAELKASGDPKPSDTIARKFAAINQAYISAVNAKHKES